MKKDIQKSKYDYLESLRQKRIKEIKEKRDTLDMNVINTSKHTRPLTGTNNLRGEKTGMPNTGFKSTAIENEKKALERMKNQNEMDLVSMVQYELKRELMKKDAEEKIRMQQEKMNKYQRELENKRKSEEMAKREKEQKASQKQKE